jgi:hypothetical protein
MSGHSASAEAGAVRDVIREDGFVMTDCRASAGWMGTSHLQEHDEAFYVLAGALTVDVGGERLVAAKYHCVFVGAQEADRKFVGGDRRARTGADRRAVNHPGDPSLRTIDLNCDSKSDVLFRTLEVPWPRATGSVPTAPFQTLRSWLPTTSWPLRPSRPGAGGSSSVAVGSSHRTLESPSALS